jgi:hypothetical protein
LSLPRSVLAARHRLLSELGDAGVERLASAHVRLTASSPLAGEIARRFLERAEVSVDEREAAGQGEPPEVAYLRGAVLALDHVARITGVREAPLPTADLLRVLGAEAGRVAALPGGTS